MGKTVEKLFEKWNCLCMNLEIGYNLGLNIWNIKFLDRKSHSICMVCDGVSLPMYILIFLGELD